MVAPNFYFKFYCASGHVYSFTVTIGPTFESKWNTDDERGFAWLIQYVNEDGWSWTYNRYENALSFSEGIVHVVRLLPKYIDFLKKTNASFWTEFYGFVRMKIDQEGSENKRKT